MKPLVYIDGQQMHSLYRGPGELREDLDPQVYAGDPGSAYPALRTLIRGPQSDVL